APLQPERAHGAARRGVVRVRRAAVLPLALRTARREGAREARGRAGARAAAPRAPPPPPGAPARAPGRRLPPAPPPPPPRTPRRWTGTPRAGTFPPTSWRASGARGTRAQWTPRARRSRRARASSALDLRLHLPVRRREAPERGAVDRVEALGERRDLAAQLRL